MLSVSQSAADWRDFCMLELAKDRVMLLFLVLAISTLVLSIPGINTATPLDCQQVYTLKTSFKKNASVPSGVYTIYPAGPKNPVKVYCEMGCVDNGIQDNQKWTVIQKRIDGNVSFYQAWEQYKNGFGDADGEYWLGLENIFLMTNRDRYQLRVDMQDFNGGSAYAQYSQFYIDPESNNYALHLGNYINGGAGDALSNANGASFSTYDKDFTGQCSDSNGGGFWYQNYYYNYYYYWWGCGSVSPNGLYKNVNVGRPGIIWQTWEYSNLKTITMKIRRLDLADLESR